MVKDPVLSLLWLRFDLAWEPLDATGSAKKTKTKNKKQNLKTNKKRHLKKQPCRSSLIAQ